MSDAHSLPQAREIITGILEGGPMKPVPADGEVVEEIECPGSAVGSIIGKGGSEIKAIQEKSGARIEIPRESSVCWVVGPKAAVASASKLIKAKIQVSKHAPRLFSFLFFLMSFSFSFPSSLPSFSSFLTIPT